MGYGIKRIEIQRAIITFHEVYNHEHRQKDQCIFFSAEAHDFQNSTVQIRKSHKTIDKREHILSK